MTRTHVAALLLLAAAVPAATAASFYASSGTPYIIAGASGCRITDSGSADFTVRIDNKTTTPDLRLQLVDESAAADFVLIDDSDTINACTRATAVQSIRLDPQAAHADLTLALSRAPAAYKIYARSANFSQQDAAALFAVIWKTAGSGREFAARD
jgi:hypothetical protein